MDGSVTNVYVPPLSGRDLQLSSCAFGTLVRQLLYSALVRWCVQEPRGLLDLPPQATALLLLPLYYSEDLSRLAARKYARIIQKLGFPVSRAQFVCPTLCVSCVLYISGQVYGVQDTEHGGKL